MRYDRPRYCRLMCTYLEGAGFVPDGVETVVLNNLGALGLLAVTREAVDGYNDVGVYDLALLCPSRFG